MSGMGARPLLQHGVKTVLTSDTSVVTLIWPSVLLSCMTAGFGLLLIWFAINQSRFGTGHLTVSDI